MSLLARAKHPLFDDPDSAPRRSYPVLSPGQFRNPDRWPRYFQPYLAGPLHIIEDYGVASRVTASTDAIWLCSTFAAMEEIRAGRLREIPIPDGQKALRIRMMLYSRYRRSLSPAALMFKERFQEPIRALSREGSAEA
jgi:DNA-binding transcriptional LysR family regulator